MRTRTILPLALVVALGACTSFGTNDAAPPEPAVADAAAVALVDAGAREEGADANRETKECVDFLTSLGEFESASSTYAPDIGFTVVVDSSTKKHAISRAFRGAGPIRRSVVDVEMRASYENTNASEYYINGIAQYFGETTAFIGSSTPLNGLQQVPNEGTKLDVWPFGGKINKPIAKVIDTPFGRRDGHVILETVWSDTDGRIAVTAGGKQAELVQATISPGASSQALTVEVGGFADDRAPKATYVVRGICVTLIP